MRRPPARAVAALGLAAALGLGAGVAPAAASCAPPAPGGDWPQMGNDLGHSRTQPAETGLTASLARTLAPVWTFSANVASGRTHNEITGYPVVAGGCVYVASSTGNARPGWVFAINADNGALVWRQQLARGVYSSLAVDGNLVYAFMSRVGDGLTGPAVVALDRSNGQIVWETVVDTQPGSDAVSSPVVFDGMVWVGVSGTAAEGNESQRFRFQGNFVLLDAGTGAQIAKTYVIPSQDWPRGYAGAAIWSTISIDAETKYGYVGTGNPFSYQFEHPRTNSILKIDLDPGRTTFGEIVDFYHGDVDQYFTAIANQIPCDDSNPVGVFLAGFECGRLDLDFGAAPNLFTDSDGRKLVGAGQKSGVYHVVDAGDLSPVWTALVGVPSPVGGIVGTAAYDGRVLYGPHTLAGYLWALDRDTGALRWISPVADGVHWGSPVTAANGVLYTVDLKGFLDAYDAATGLPLLHRPMALGSGTRQDPAFSWGAATVARGTVFASVGIGVTSIGAYPPWPEMPNGFVLAFRPDPALPALP